VKTAGEAKQLALKCDRSKIAKDGHDISFVTLTVVDKAGVTVPRSGNLVHFSITGPGEIVATDNGDATDLSSFQDLDRKAFNGMALAVVKAKRGERGTITVTATSDGLKTASATIKLK
jgi:beta-galactosidase